jgi:predicted aspartyl protease
MIKYGDGMFVTGFRRRAGAACVLAALSVTAAQAQTPPAATSPVTPPLATPLPDALQSPEKLALAEDQVSRMTIPVTIDGQGPFPFVIDTGADRTVISEELAAKLKLPMGPRVLLHNSGGVDDIGTAVITRLGVGSRVIPRIEAPVLAAHNLGAMGMLGIDSLSDQHVVMDFKSRQFLSMPSRSETQTADTIVVRGKSRFGQLILVDAEVRGVKVFVILDSGAESTVGNLALERLLRGRADEGAKLSQVISVTGRRTPANFEEVSEMHVGALTIRNVPLAFAELHTFARFGLTDRPAMLLGMDVMSTCRRVTVDFKRREASFTLNRE